MPRQAPLYVQVVLIILFVLSLTGYPSYEENFMGIKEIFFMIINKALADQQQPESCQIEVISIPVGIGQAPYFYAITKNDRRTVAHIYSGKYVTRNDIESLKRGGNILETPERQAKLQELLSNLQAQGWKVTGRGSEWFSYILQR